MKYITHKLTYPEARQLINTLKTYKIDAHISNGCVSMDLESDQVSIVEDEVSKLGGSLHKRNRSFSAEYILEEYKNKKPCS